MDCISSIFATICTIFIISSSVMRRFFKHSVNESMKDKGCVISHPWEDINTTLSTKFKTFSKNNFSLNLTFYRFFRNYLCYLGHLFKFFEIYDQPSAVIIFLRAFDKRCENLRTTFLSISICDHMYYYNLLNFFRYFFNDSILWI